MNRLNGASKTKARASFVMVNCYWENGSAVVLICITHSPTHTPCLLSFIRSFFFSKISVRINDDGRAYSSLPTATSSSAHPTRTLHQILHGSAVVCRASLALPELGKDRRMKSPTESIGEIRLFFMTSPWNESFASLTSSHLSYICQESSNIYVTAGKGRELHLSDTRIKVTPLVV